MSKQFKAPKPNKRFPNPKAIEKTERLAVPLQEEFVSRFRINPWLSWLIIGEILGGTAYLAVLLSHGNMMWIGQLAFMYAIVFMIAGAGPIWVRDEMEKLLPAFNAFIKLPPQRIKNWYTSELRRTYSPIGTLACGMILSILAIWSFVFMTEWYTRPVVWWGTPWGDWTVTIVVSILALLLGMDLYLIIQLAVLVHRIPNLPLQMTIYQHPSASISAVGKVLQRFTTICAITLGLISLTAIPLSPFRYQTGMILIVWLIFAGCIVLAFFIFPQYRLHTAMVNAKATKIRTFVRHLSTALDKAIHEPTSDQVAYAKELFELYQHLSEMPEWPFDARNLFSVIGAVLIPILLSIVQQYLLR